MQLSSGARWGSCSAETCLEIYMMSSLRSPRRSVSSSSGGSSSSENENTVTKLNPATLEAHDSSQSYSNTIRSHNSYVGSWIDSQNEYAKDSSSSVIQTMKEVQNTTPAILLTNVDEDITTPTELLSAQERAHIPGRMRRHSMRVDRQLSPARKVSMFPAPVNQTILEEPEEMDEELEIKEEGEDSSDVIQTLDVGGIPRIKTNVNVPVDEEDLLAGINSRQRAMSYPSQASPAPMLELLPRQNAQQSQPQGEQTSEKTGLHKFAQVALMAKKWKKRSSDCENEVYDNTLESIAIRQKKRPFVEVPRSLKVDILEDAYPIVHKTYQMYKSCLGPRHKLTMLAEKHLENLSLQLEK